MDAATDTRRHAKSLVGSIKNRFVFLDSIDEAILRTIRFGVISHFATWSSPSNVSLKLIAEVLSDQVFESIPLFVADFDCTYYPTVVYEGVAFGGYGETFWVNDGHVVSGLQKLSPETKSAAILNCRRLLEAASDDLRS